jgi:hypothetical protein
MREKFDKLVELIGDKIDRGDEFEFDVRDFERFRDYVLNWEVVERCIEEENEEGFSDSWDDIKFA